MSVFSREAEAAARWQATYNAAVAEGLRRYERHQRQADENGRRAAMLGAVRQMFTFGRQQFPDVLGTVLGDDLVEPLADALLARARDRS